MGGYGGVEFVIEDFECVNFGGFIIVDDVVVGRIVDDDVDEVFN